MPVHVRPARNEQPARAYAACDRRDDMGRVKIGMGHLQQWHITEGQVALWVSSELGLKSKPKQDKASGVFTLGSLQGKKRSGVLEFQTVELVNLKTSGHSLPLSELVVFNKDRPSIDRGAILDLVDLPESAGGYQRSTARREARKFATLERYAAWEKSYRELKRKRRGMSDVWYSQQIGKQLNANAETIRKHMRK